MQVQKAGKADIMYTLSSDDKWIATLSPCTHTGSKHWADYGGEAYDYHLEQIGWDTAEGNVSNWSPAVIHPMKQEVTPEVLEPTRVVDSLTATSVVACGDCPPEANLLGGI